MKMNKIGPRVSGALHGSANDYCEVNLVLHKPSPHVSKPEVRDKGYISVELLSVTASF